MRMKKMSCGDPPITQIGWECPRCHRINAPYVGQCTCAPEWKDVIPAWPPVEIGDPPPGMAPMITC